MNGPSKLATIECSTCSVLLEVYPQDLPGEPSLCWNTLDEFQMRCSRSAGLTKGAIWEQAGWKRY